MVLRSFSFRLRPATRTTIITCLPKRDFRDPQLCADHENTRQNHEQIPHLALRLRLLPPADIDGSTARTLAGGAGPAISAAIDPLKHTCAKPGKGSRCSRRIVACSIASRQSRRLTAQRDDTIVLSFSALALDGRLSCHNFPSKTAHEGDLLRAGEGVQMIALGSRILLIVPPKLSFANGEWPPASNRHPLSSGLNSRTSLWVVPHPESTISAGRANGRKRTRFSLETDRRMTPTTRS